MSWVIVDRQNGTAVLETFSATLAAAVNRARYDVVPILEYLQELNRRIACKQN